MTRHQDINTGRYALAYPKGGKLVLVLNTDYYSLIGVKLLLADRKANGESFPNEQVVQLWVSLQWFGQHSGGTESFPCHLFPKAI